MSRIEVKVPDIGDYDSVPVIEVLVADGEMVEKDQPLLVLESDKATMEVPAPAAGTVRGLKVKAGDKLSEGDAICVLETGQGAKAEAGEAAPAPQPARPQAAPTEAPAPQPAAQRETPAAPRQAASAPPARTEVRVPDIGNYSGVPVIEVLVADGEAVEQDQPLIVLESDKATMEVPAPAAGTVRALKVKAGDKLSEGDPVCILETAADADAGSAPAAKTAETEAPPPPSPAAEAPAPRTAAAAPATAPPAAPADTGGAQQLPYAGPATRKFARELGVDLAQVSGSGPRGRILIEDVQGFVKQRLLRAAAPAGGGASGGAGIPPIPAVDFAQFGEIELRPLARIRKLSAAHLHRSWLNVPHVTQFDEADITELESFRKQQSEALAATGGPKLTLLPFLIKAVAAAMRQYPEFNAALSADGEQLVLKKYCHIGFAADTPNGLVVPVVRDVWHKNLAELAAECALLAKKARDGKLKADEMKGGCFSISSLGGIGGSHFTPIVNAPEVGILGVSRSQMKPVWDGQQFGPRLMCPLSLSYDHRVIDGAYAARFIVHLVQLLGDIRRLLL